MTINDDLSSIVEVRNHLFSILDKQTIRGVTNQCRNLVEEKNLPTFQNFIENESDFILTERRSKILEQLQQELANEASPAVILHGSFGSGKTVLMENVAELCDGPREIGGVQFPQIRYGDTDIDCLKISVQDHDSPKKFLQAIYSSLMSSSALDQQDVLDRFNAEKDSLSLDGLETLPDSIESDLKGYIEDPKSIEQIAKACKSLSAPAAHETIVWFSELYYEREGNYPGFYVDEFEQVFRHLDPNDESTLKRLIKKMMRSSVTTHEEREIPPYILFVNSVGFDELPDVIQAPEDLVSRLDQSISYNIDLSMKETKQLFSELYHLYANPLLADYNEQVPDWAEKITEAEASDSDYIYPFTDEAVEFALRITDTPRDADRDERVVRAFRAYKSVLMAYFEKWEGKSRIDRNFLYKNGDNVRDRISQLDRADASEVPGEESINKRIFDDYEDESLATKRALNAIARVGILERNENPALFSPSEIKEILEGTETELTVAISELIDIASEGAEYFGRDNDHLSLDQYQLTGAAATSETKSGPEIVQDIVNELNINSIDTQERWVESLKTKFAKDLDIDVQDQYVTIDVLGEFHHTETVYFSVSAGPSPAELDANVDSNALHPVVHLGPSDQDPMPAKFEVSERNDQASDMMDAIEDSLNNQIKNHIDADGGTSTLLAYIKDAFPQRNEFERYRLFLKLSLADILGQDLPEQISDRTAGSRVFDILRYVRENVKGQYGDGEYATELLGLSGGYSGKDVLDVVYGIKHLKREGQLIYENPNIYEITREMPQIQGISRRKTSGEDFKNLLSKFEEERFVKVDDDDCDIIHDFSEGTEKIISSLQTSLSKSDEQELSIDAVIREIFGTGSIASVTEAYIYLILSVADLYKDPFVLSGDRGDKIVFPESQIETVRDQARRSVENAIKYATITEAKKENPDLDNIESLKELYESLSNLDDRDEIRNLTEDIQSEVTIDAGELEQSVRSLGSEPVYAETDVSRYITAVRSFNDVESGLPMLIEDDLHHLIDQLQDAAEVLAMQSTAEEHADVVEELTGDTVEIYAGDIAIPCIDSVSTHLESHSVADEIESASISSDIEEYLEGDVSEEMLVDRLSRLRKAIVPQVIEYEPAGDKEVISSDLDDLEIRFQEAIDSKRDQIEDAEEQIEYYKPRIPEGEAALITKGERQIRQCKEELEEPIDEFDASEYSSIWESWKQTEEELASEALGEDEIRSLIDDLGIELSVDSVTSAATDLNDVLEEITEEEFIAIAESLDIEIDKAKELQASLVKRWLQGGKNS